MAEILSAETLKSTKVGNIEEAKNIIKKLMAAEKDQTKTSKPNAAKLKKWQTAIKAYEQTETKARALHAKITNAHPDLLNGKDVLNVTINEMQAALAKLDPEKRNAILSGSGIDEIQDVKLNNDLFENGGFLSNLGGDFLKGGDKSVAVSKAFTGVAIASFAASGIASVFKAATGKALTGALLKDGAMTALNFLGKNILLPIWNFNPVGTALIAAVVAMKVIPVVARFVNKMKNNFAALTRASTMKNKLAELAEQDGPSVEFENEYTAHTEHHDKHTQAPDESGRKVSGNGKNPPSNHSSAPTTLRERLNSAKTKKERESIFKSASIEEHVQYQQEIIDECEKNILGTERAVNNLVSQYSSADDARQKAIAGDLKVHSEKAGNDLKIAEDALRSLDNILKTFSSNDIAYSAQNTAAAKLIELRGKVNAIKDACKNKTAIKDPSLKETKKTTTVRSLQDSVKIYLTTCAAFDNFRETQPEAMLNKNFEELRKTHVAGALKNIGFELTQEEFDAVYSQVSDIFKMSEKEEKELNTTITANELAVTSEIKYIEDAPAGLDRLFAESPVNTGEVGKVLTVISEKINSLSIFLPNMSEIYQEKIKTAISKGENTIETYQEKLNEAKKTAPENKAGADTTKTELEELLNNMRGSYQKLLEAPKDADKFLYVIKGFFNQIKEKAGDNPEYASIVEAAQNTVNAAEASLAERKQASGQPADENKSEKTEDQNKPGSKKPSGIASEYIRQFANGNFIGGHGFVSNRKGQAGLNNARDFFKKINSGTYTPKKFGELSAEDREFLSAFGDKVLAEAQRSIEGKEQNAPANLTRKDASKEALKQQGLSEEEIAAIIGKQ